MEGQRNVHHPERRIDPALDVRTHTEEGRRNLERLKDQGIAAVRQAFAPVRQEMEALDRAAIKAMAAHRCVDDKLAAWEPFGADANGIRGKGSRLVGWGSAGVDARIAVRFLPKLVSSPNGLASLVDAHYTVLGAVTSEMERLGRQLVGWFPGADERARCIELQFEADKAAGTYRAFLEDQARPEREARAAYTAAGRDFDAEPWGAQG